MAVQISGNDITVPRDGTFTRNVTIGGTLTYEDVTNIDSVGLVTARTGIEIGARPGVAASISIDGNAIFSGITTGTFSGGATGNFSIEDKIIHTGDTNTAIRFPSADTITTETGGTERLRITSAGLVGIGQATPTHMLHVDSSSASDTTATAFFKGRILRVDGAAASNSPRLNLSLDGTDKSSILLNRTDNSLAVITLTSAPIICETNDVEALRIDPYGRVLIGETSAIIGSSSEFSEIVLGGKTRGAGVTLQDEDANVRFQIRTDDDASGFQGTLLNASTNHGISIRTNNTEKIRLRANGLQTITYQYFLHAGRSGDQTGFNAGGDYGTPMTYNNIVTENKDSTLSSCFNTSNGLFTAPVPGTYLFIASAYTTTGNVLQQSWFTLNGARASGTDIVSNNTASYAFVHSQTIMRLSAGNTVGFKPYGSGQSNLTIDDNANHTYFKVTLLS